MEMSKQKVLAMAGLCTLLLLSFTPTDVSAQCSIAQLSNCVSAVTRGTDPTPACCMQVGAVTDFNCFCNIMLSQAGSLPQEYINNAVMVPSKCGEEGAYLRNRDCGNVHIP